MKASIITVVFNRKDTIARTLESVKNQSYKNIERVIVDGKSWDGTSEIIRKHALPDDKVIIESDKGIYDAINKGINLSSGDVIALLHSDDFYYDKNVIEFVMKIFSEKQADIVYGDVSFFKKNNFEKTSRIYKSDELSEKNLAWGKMPDHPAMFIKREVFEKVGLYKTNYKIAADYEFLCRLVKNFNFRAIYISKVLVRMQTGGISTRGIGSFIILNKEVLEALLSNGIYSNFFMLFSKYFSKFKQFFSKNNL